PQRVHSVSLFHSAADHQHTLSFPTRRSSDLARLDLLQLRICSLSKPVSTVQPVTPVWLVTEYEVTPVPSGSVSIRLTLVAVPGRSEERRVGRECSCGGGQALQGRKSEQRISL